MSDVTILFSGVFCLTMTLLGLVLTMREFSRMVPVGSGLASAARSERLQVSMATLAAKRIA